jgi:hypothetical protein
MELIIIKIIFFNIINKNMKIKLIKELEKKNNNLYYILRRKNIILINLNALN